MPFWGASGGGGASLPSGGSSGDVLAKNDAGDLVWVAGSSRGSVRIEPNDLADGASPGSPWTAVGTALIVDSYWYDSNSPDTWPKILTGAGSSDDFLHTGIVTDVASSDAELQFFWHYPNSVPSNGPQVGFILRYVDMSNYILVGFGFNNDPAHKLGRIVVGGNATIITMPDAGTGAFTANATVSARLVGNLITVSAINESGVSVYSGSLVLPTTAPTSTVHGFFASAPGSHDGLGRLFIAGL